MKGKISLLAVATALVAPSAAWAQVASTWAKWNWTLYGTVDVGYQNVSNFGPGVANRSAFQNAGGKASKLGLSSTKDLAGGLTAGGVIEFDVTADSGAEGVNQMTGRQTFVSLASQNWGKVTVGRQLTNSYDLAVTADGFAYANSFQSYFNMEDIAPRSSNYLKYVSPRWRGFAFGAGWAPGEDATRNTSMGDSNNLNRNYVDFMVRFDSGSFGIGYGYSSFRNNTRASGALPATPVGTLGRPLNPAQAAGLDNRETDNSVEAYYKLDWVRLFGLYTTSKQSGEGAAKNLSLIGARVEVDIGDGILAFSIARRTNKRLDNADSSHVGLGYYHQLDKSTWLYTTAGRRQNDEFGTLGLLGQWSPTVAGSDPFGFQVGMNYAF